MAPATQSAGAKWEERHNQLELHGRSDAVSSFHADERHSQLLPYGRGTKSAPPKWTSNEVSSSSSPATKSAGDREEERRSQLLLSPDSLNCTWKHGVSLEGGNLQLTGSLFCPLDDMVVVGGILSGSGWEDEEKDGVWELFSAENQH
jgi:hypothetical protein